MHRIAAVVAGLSLALVGTSATLAATINVPGDYPTIQGAIDASSNGDVITVAAGDYSGVQVEDIALSIIGATYADGSPAVLINGSIELSGQGAAQSTVENLQCRTMVMIDCTASISNCTIVDGQDQVAGLLLAHFQGTLEGCRIANCYAEFLPGGVYVTDQFDGMQIESTDATFIDCVIENNSGSCPFPSCGGDAGVTIEQGDVEFIGCTIRDNAAGFGGILVSSLSTASFTDTTVCGNSSPGQIYGAWVDNGGNCVQDSCDDCDEVCPGDFDGSGVVDVSDLLAVIAGWDDPYNVNDLLLVISEWNTTCP